jgi:hypothetical protein
MLDALAYVKAARANGVPAALDDRLFPNQDILPEGGYGNLIAAPL